MLKIDSNLIWTIINIIIFFVLVRAVLFKPIAKIIKEREELVKGQLDEARRTNEEADELKAHYEETIKTAKDESMQIVRSARERATKEAQQMAIESEERSKRMIEKAEIEAKRQKEQAVKEAESQIAALAVAAAAKIINEASSEKLDEDIYLKYLDRVGESSEGSGN